MGIQSWYSEENQAKKKMGKLMIFICLWTIMCHSAPNLDKETAMTTETIEASMETTTDNPGDSTTKNPTDSTTAIPENLEPEETTTEDNDDDVDAYDDEDDDIDDDK